MKGQLPMFLLFWFRTYSGRVFFFDIFLNFFRISDPAHINSHSEAITSSIFINRILVWKPDTSYYWIISDLTSLGISFPSFFNMKVKKLLKIGKIVAKFILQVFSRSCSSSIVTGKWVQLEWFLISSRPLLYYLIV